MNMVVQAILFKNKISSILKSEKGQGMTEYAVLLALIVGIVVAVTTGLDTSIDDLFTKITTKINTVTP